MSIKPRIPPSKPMGYDGSGRWELRNPDGRLMCRGTYGFCMANLPKKNADEYTINYYAILAELPE
jgi:hypothetical protein